MSRRDTPKQLIPFIGGKSLLQLAWERAAGLVPPDHCWVCAGERHRDAVLAALPELGPVRFLGEPQGRDTLGAIGYSAAAIQAGDPEASMAVFPADHLIRPAGVFQRIVREGFEVVESTPCALVTFGIEPSSGATGYGYLELGEKLGGSAVTVRQFREKPDAGTAQLYYEAGPGRFLWNSGMFVWRAATLLDCVRRYEPAVFAGLARVADAWNTPRREAVLREVYPQFRKVSVDYAVMEPASRDSAVRVAALPMPLEWMDVGSWATFAKTCAADERGNAVAAARSLLEKTTGSLAVSSDPGHLIAALGCEDLIIVHTRDATLVCRKDQAESIKALQEKIAGLFGDEYA